MNILELLNSTYRMGERRRPSFVFSKKPFGSVYAYNKTVIYKPNNSIVEISMYITTATELNKTAHKVSVSLHGVNISEYTKEYLFSIIKMQTKYNKLEDAELIEKIQAEEEIIKDKFIIQSGASTSKFLLIDKRIPLTTQIRVKCSCSDYYYTFAWYNSEKKVHIGMKPPKYIPYRSIDKNDGDFRPKRNPNRYPGICKHLLLFIAMLMDGRIISPSNQLVGSFSGNKKRLEIYSRKDISIMLKKVKDELQEQNKLIREQRLSNKEYYQSVKKSKK